MKRALLLVLAAGVNVSAASSPYGDFLPPDQAFRFSAGVDSGAVVLQWDIADNYYLYRDRFRFKAAAGAFAAVEFPSGKIKQDPYFGKVVIYRGQLSLRLPVKRVPASGKIKLKVTYRGCADAGLCYPPITKVVVLPVSAS